MSGQDDSEVAKAPEESGDSPSETERSERKRSAVAKNNDGDSDHNRSNKIPKLETVDLAISLGFKAGDRIEVEWEVADDEDTGVLNTRWWGSTLKAHDGRTTSEGLAIRVLDYDPYPEGGFPERSLEEVVFATPNVLVHPDALEQQSDDIDELHFRREGEEETVTMNNESLRCHLNELLVDIMKEKTITSAFRNMDAAQQAQFAEVVANGKEKLIDAIQTQWDQTRKVLTPEDIPGIMEQAFGYKQGAK
jgi:hypothetical protein